MLGWLTEPVVQVADSLAVVAGRPTRPGAQRGEGGQRLERDGGDAGRGEDGELAGGGGAGGGQTTGGVGEG